MGQRIADFSSFWPYYLAEHRHPTSRRLHFLGTTGFIAAAVASVIAHPIVFPLALVGFGLVLSSALLRGETERPSKLHVVAMLAMPIAASPVWFPLGVVFAYGCAWLGHFGCEKNRPATFHYPVWSLVADWKMWSYMLRGRLWRGDPLRELGLRAPFGEPSR